MRNRDHLYLPKLQDYYARHRMLPSYAGLAAVLGLSKRGAAKFAARLLERGVLEKGPGGRLRPAPPFFARPRVGTAPAGFTSPAEEVLEDSLRIDEYLIEHPARTVLVEVHGDSMRGAGIHDGDHVVVERRDRARAGNIVVAIIDGEFTIKYLARDRRGHYLKPANPHYPDIRPQGEWRIFGIVVGLFRKYRP